MCVSLSLLPFAAKQDTNEISFALTDYLELTDWSGRHVDLNKTGFIDSSEPKILANLGIEQDIWLEAIKNFRRKYGNFAGSENGQIWDRRENPFDNTINLVILFF